MNVTRKSIAAFSAAIIVSLVARLSPTSLLPQRDVVFAAGLILGGALWVLGVYYGYEAVRTERDA